MVFAKRALVDLPSAGIALLNLILRRFKLREPVAVLLSGGIGLVILLLKKG